MLSQQYWGTYPCVVKRQNGGKIMVDMREFRRARTLWRDEAMLNKILWYEHWSYPKEHACQF